MIDACASKLIALILSALLISGCSNAVVIPREDLAKNEYRKEGDYRIKLRGWNEYHAHKFSVTDSTLVIEELDKGDDRYKLKKHDMPIVVPLKDVEYIGEMKNNPAVTKGVVIGVVVVAALCYWISTWDLSFE